MSTRNSKKVSVRDLDLRNKRVLTRVDFNVPLSRDGKVTDNTRIQKTIPTIKLIQDRGGGVILMSHLGRPNGKPVPEMSLEPVAAHLSELLGKPVKFVSDCIGEEAHKASVGLEARGVMLLENLRFHTGETDNDPEFSQKLARMGDIYVNDAFGAAHRAHASTVGVTKFIDICAAGLLLEKEIEFLSSAIENPTRPLVAILGGAKISGKIEVIENLLPKVDSLLIGGGMAFTFFKAMGYEIGKSILEADRIEIAKKLLQRASSEGCELLLPVDVCVTESLEGGVEGRQIDANVLESDMIGVDIGAKTINLFGDRIEKAGTVIWNGPMGIFENPEFATGTFEIARCLSRVTAKGGVTIVGGGDSVAAVNQAGIEDQISHISTGGGASLEFLSGYELPGLAALTDRGD